MRSLVVARKEFADARRSKRLWVVVALFVLLTGGVSAVPALVPGQVGTAGTGVRVATAAAAFLLPIIALVSAYDSVTAERDTGSIRVLLSLPPSRGDVVAGKLLGRSAVVVAATAAGTVATGVVGLALYGSLAVVELVSLLGMVSLMGVVYVGVAVGISAATSRRSRAMAVTVAFYMVTVVLWNVGLAAVRLLGMAAGVVTPDSTPGWLRFLELLPPNAAFTRAYTGLAGVSPAEPVVLSVLVLVGWLVVPPALGYLLFRSADLG